MKRCAALLLCLLVAPSMPNAQPASEPSISGSLIRQSSEAAALKSRSCLACHGKIEPMHVSAAFHLGCTDCHGGDATARDKDRAHVRSSHPGNWPTTANPERSFTDLNRESLEFIRFVNPGDLRVAGETCGPCHEKQVLAVQKSLMTTSAMFWGGAAYNNGVVSAKNYFLGESYGPDGLAQRINAAAPPTKEQRLRGILPFLLPLPRWESFQVADPFRSFERGGRVSRINPSEIGIPDPFEEPGRPDMKLSARGNGTELRISSPVLNIHKTRLNDPHLSFLGTNDHPGDFRSSGCTACHVVYANDRSPVASGPYASFGHGGLSVTADSAIAKREAGHPIRHQFTSAIPTSQCMTCHHHQPNSFVNTFLGFQAWDYETDAGGMYPPSERKLSEAEEFKRLDANPEEAVLRGNWGDPAFLSSVADGNKDRDQTQFADYHGHGWLFRAVFRKDRKGNLLDEKGQIVSWDDRHKFHGVVPLEGETGLCGDPACADARKAVHLKDIHAEKGMHCVDCHFGQDSHGDGNLYGEFHNAIEIQCVDCHGTITQEATLRTSGPAAAGSGSDLTGLFTPFQPKQRRFQKARGKVIQRSMVDPDLEWEVPQVKASVDPKSPRYNERACKAKLMTGNGTLWTPDRSVTELAHPSERMECYSCHSSWVTNCFGCHLPQQANRRKSMNHFEGGESRNWTTYNPQVVRDEGFMLGLHATSKGAKVAPVRSSSALILSSQNSNREQIYLQQPPVSAGGYSSQAFNPHFPHTVRRTETRTCTDCHLSQANDNNAWMAQLLLQGTNFVNFIGKYAWVGLGRSGIEAVAVTETEEPQAVIGSYLHSLAFPDAFRRHRDDALELKTAHHHGGTNIRSLQLRGEYLYTANGSDGFRVYDVANIDNKGFSERIVSAPVSGLGQKTNVPMKDATAVALPTNMPIDTRRTVRPENQEQPFHPLYSFAYVTDSVEGLILVDVMPLADGDPRNNFLERAVTFNPGGILNGATNLTLAGSNVYICCDAGLVVVSVDDPHHPRVIGQVGSPEIVKPTAVAVQFRYAFVCDASGLKIINVTNPEKPMKTPDGFVPLTAAMDVYVARTYAYVAAGSEGLAIVDVENPEAPKLDQRFTADGKINDARGVRVGSTNASLYAYVADGRNGLRVIQLTSPVRTPGYLGFSPRPEPELIATHHTHGPALAVSKGLDRDRAVDETGNQVSVFGRLGSRPFRLEEQQLLYLRNSRIWTVNDAGEVRK